MHGFVNLGDVNEQLLKLEQKMCTDEHQPELATHMLTLMVRGIFFKLEFPYASFPTLGIGCHCLICREVIVILLQVLQVNCCTGLCGRLFGGWKSLV